MSAAASTSSATAYTLIAEASEGLDVPPAQDLRNALQNGTDDLRLDVLRRIITATMNGTAYVSCDAVRACQGCCCFDISKATIYRWMHQWMSLTRDV